MHLKSFAVALTIVLSPVRLCHIPMQPMREPRSNHGHKHILYSAPYHHGNSAPYDHGYRGTPGRAPAATPTASPTRSPSSTVVTVSSTIPTTTTTTTLSSDQKKYDECVLIANGILGCFKSCGDGSDVTAMRHFENFIEGLADTTKNKQTFCTLLGRLTARLTICTSRTPRAFPQCSNDAAADDIIAIQMVCLQFS